VGGELEMRIFIVFVLSMGAALFCGTAIENTSLAFFIGGVVGMVNASLLLER
jgi:hypothetical protein